MKLLDWFRKTKKIERPRMEKSLRPWRRQKVTTILADDVTEFLAETAKNTRVPRGSIIDMAVRRFRKDLEDGIRSQEVEVPESIIYNLKRSKVMSRLLEENSQLIIRNEPERRQDQEREEVE